MQIIIKNKFDRLNSTPNDAIISIHCKCCTVPFIHSSIAMGWNVEWIASLTDRSPVVHKIFHHFCHTALRPLRLVRKHNKVCTLHSAIATNHFQFCTHLALHYVSNIAAAAAAAKTNIMRFRASVQRSAFNKQSLQSYNISTNQKSWNCSVFTVHCIEHVHHFLAGI